MENDMKEETISEGSFGCQLNFFFNKNTQELMSLSLGCVSEGFLREERLRRDDLP